MFRKTSLLIVLALCSAFYFRFAVDSDIDWPEYLGGPDRNHYSPLVQIDTSNVQRLSVAWSYSAPDTGQMQMNAIVVKGVLYGVSSALQVFALDAVTGRELWRFGDPFKSTTSTCRGVAYWTDGKDDTRILFTSGQWLYALDAGTGKPVTGFGDAGRVSLRTGLGMQAKDKFVISNTPGTVFGNVIIMPMRLSESADAAPGHIQAFDVRSGKLAWLFHTIPQPGEFGYDTWPKDSWKNTDVGGANSWAGMAIDRKRGIVYIPTGSAAFDFYGGNRKGSNLFANCLLALDAHTGKRLWHYQLVHHDIWDRDLPSPPNLVTIEKKGADGKSERIDAVAITTKSGHVLVFDRVTGKSLFPIKEVPVEQSKLPGEASWPTQPMPMGTASFVRQAMTEADINPYSKDRDSLTTIFRKIKKGFYAPPDKSGTLIFPGIDGGAEWGGSAVDPEGIIYVNANEMPWILTMIDAPKQSELDHLSAGEQVYTLNCSGCHGANRKGNVQSGYPSLVDIGQKRDREYVRQIVGNGKGMMPGFATLKAGEREALVAFLFGDEKHEVMAVAEDGKKIKAYLPYKITGYHKFLDSKGYPAVSPPWGTLTAINLNTGKLVWQNVLGEYPELKAKGIPPTGSENYGGPVVTAGGVLFIAATRDGMFRAYNKRTGKLLWEYQLPAAGFATPSTYQIGGKQYVVIACGGGKLGAKKGNQLVAFALP